MLNDTKIKQFKPKDKVYRVADYGGLCLEVRLTGAKFWRYRYRFLGKAAMLTIGEYPTVGLAQARKLAEDQKELISKNIDPSKYKVEEKERIKLEAEINFEQVALEWHEIKKATRSESHRRTIEKSFKRDIFPAFGRKSIKLITPYDILKMQKNTIERVSKQMNHGTGETSAIINRQIVNAVFNYAIANLKCEANPTTALGQTVERPPKDTARPMTIEERQRFHYVLSKSRSTEMVKNAIKFLLYSMMRSVEICRLKWDWVDFDENIITIPAATKDQMSRGERNIKMNRIHMVPVSRQMLVILSNQKIQSNNEYVFCSVFNATKVMNKTTINRALGSMGFDTLTAHDFRATASTILHEMKYESTHIELQLAHVDKNQVRGTYNHAQHLNERRTMMQDWADIVDSWADLK